jgi:predicted PolB exonuclease-like 3'-5' exonuclease
LRPYFHRFSDDALDLCDALGSFTPGARVKLDEICKILGLPGKPEGVDGSRVEEMVLAGQIEEVARYCESDVNCSSATAQDVIAFPAISDDLFANVQLLQFFFRTTRGKEKSDFEHVIDRGCGCCFR